MTDSARASIASAKVTVRDVATHLVREVTAGPDGAYRFAALSPGTYEVFVAQPGFAPYHHAGVLLPLGSAVHMDIQLQPASLTTQLTVTAQPPSLDPTQTSAATSIDTERIEELPA